MKPATLKDWIKLPFIVLLHAPFAILGFIFLKTGEFLLGIAHSLPGIQTVETEKRKAQIAELRKQSRA